MPMIDDVSGVRLCKQCGGPIAPEKRDSAMFCSMACNSKSYHARNREVIAVRKKAHYDRNKEAILDRRKAYYDKNSEALDVHRKAYYDRNKEAIAVRMKAYNARNKEAISVRRKVYYLENRKVILKDLSTRHYKVYRPMFKAIAAICAKTFDSLTPERQVAYAMALVDHKSWRVYGAVSYSPLRDRVDEAYARMEDG